MTKSSVLNQRPRLSIVMGLPGAGKTTLATSLETTQGGIRMCPDDWMDALGIDIWDSDTRDKVEQFQWQLARQLLALGNHVIIEWGTWGRDERDILRLGAREFGATVVLYHLDEPLDVLYARINTRGREDPPITREDLEEWAAIIQRPTPEELALFDQPDDEPVS
ncbi:MAG: AAA family ATPase [Chloroflexota bacterium]